MIGTYNTEKLVMFTLVSEATEVLWYSTGAMSHLYAYIVGTTNDEHRERRGMA